MVPIWNDDHDSRFVRKTQPIFPRITEAEKAGVSIQPPPNLPFSLHWRAVMEKASDIEE